MGHHGIHQQICIVDIVRFKRRRICVLYTSIYVTVEDVRSFQNIGVRYSLPRPILKRVSIHSVHSKESEELVVDIKTIGMVLQVRCRIHNFAPLIEEVKNNGSSASSPTVQLVPCFTWRLRFFRFLLRKQN